MAGLQLSEADLELPLFAIEQADSVREP